MSLADSAPYAGDGGGAATSPDKYGKMRLPLGLPDVVMESTSATTWGSCSSPTSSRKGGASVCHTPSLTSLTSLRADAGAYTLFSPTQNIASACADPRKSRAEIAVFFTRHWGEQFGDRAAPPANARLRRPDHEAIVAYWKRFAQALRRRRRCKRAAQLGEQKRAVSALDLRPVTSPASDLPSPGSAVDISSIPPVYFRDDFNFQDVDTFRQVFLDDGGNFGSQRMLQQKLEHYQDAIETRLNAQLATKSRQFFKAVTTYNDLSTQLAETQCWLRKLRSQMAELNQLVVSRAFRALWLHRARCNHAALLRRLRVLASVTQSQGSVQLLLGTYQYASALDEIAHTGDVLAEHLSGVVCFRHVGAQLHELRAAIAHMLEQEIARCVKSELQRQPTEQSAGVVYEEQLGSVVVGLTRLREYRFMDVFKVEIIEAARGHVRQTIRDYLYECEQVNRADPSVHALGDQMRKMGLDEWMDLLHVLINNMMLFVNKIETIESTLRDIVSESLCDRRRRPSDCDVLAEFDALVPHAVAAAQERLAKVLAARAKDGFVQRLSPERYAQVCRVLYDFCDRCDSLAASAAAASSPRQRDVDESSSAMARSVSTASVLSLPAAEGGGGGCDAGRPEQQQRRTVAQCPLLRQAVQGQTAAFAAAFHEGRRAKLCTILDSERWRAADVPAGFQRVADVCAGTGRLTDVTGEEHAGTARSHLDVNGDKYVVVGTALLLLRMLAQYCDCAALVPNANGELLPRAVELLKTFNSRTCQLILGAGAMELVGLSRITVRHMALASRCLQLIAYFVPFVERHFRPPAGAAGGAKSAPVAFRHVAQVLSDYGNHVQEIHNTLVSVVDDQLRRCIGEWQSQGVVPSASFQQIAKHVTRFYENIETVLPNDQTQTLLFRVHDGFKRTLKTRLYELDVTPRDGATYGLVCAEFSHYMDALRAMPCCAALNDTMNEVMAGAV